MAQERAFGGMVSILTYGAVRRKSKWAVVLWRSDIVSGEIGIVAFNGIPLKEGRWGQRMFE